MNMKLLSSLFAATVLCLTASQAVLMEAEEGIDKSNLYAAMSQDAASNAAQPVTNTNLRLVIADVHAAHDGSMKSATSEDLDIQVSEDGLISTNAWKGPRKHDAADISIYAAYISQELPCTGNLNNLEINETVTIRNRTSIATEVARIDDLSYRPNVQHIPNGSDSVFISAGDSSKDRNIVSLPKPPKNTPVSLASLVLSSLNISTVRAEKDPLLNSYSLSRTDGLLFER